MKEILEGKAGWMCDEWRRNRKINDDQTEGRWIDETNRGGGGGGGREDWVFTKERERERVQEEFCMFPLKALETAKDWDDWLIDDEMGLLR